MVQGDTLTTAEVAELLGCSRWTVARLVASGALPAVKVAGIYVYDRSDVAAYLEAS